MTVPGALVGPRRAPPVYYHPEDPNAGVVAEAFRLAHTVASPTRKRRVQEAQRQWWLTLRDRTTSPDEVVLCAVSSAMDAGVRNEVLAGLSVMGLVEGAGPPTGKIIGVKKRRLSKRTKQALGIGALLILIFAVGGSAWLLASMSEIRDIHDRVA